MSPDLGLGSLLAALRQVGIRVGVAETARLQHVFSLPQALSGDKATRMKSILQAVLAKDTDERVTIDRVVDLWMVWAERELDSHRDPQHPVLFLRSRSKSRSWRAWSLAALLVLALAAVLRPLPERRPPPPAPLPTFQERHDSEPPASTLPEVPAPSTRTFRSEVPIFQVIMPQPVWTGWPPLSLGVLAAVSAVGLWITLRKRRWLPEHAPLPERKGPPRVLLPSPALLEPQLLEPRHQEALVWGIGRFVAEEPSRRVDLPASVRSTVRAGGLPEIRYQQARHFREVWLWVDEAADDPVLPRLADEVELVLRTHGLPVEQASFRGIPGLLVTPSGQVVAPGEIDELRKTALVAVLTDGRVLARQYTSDDRRVILDTLLRGLSHWPHLVFVTFSSGDNDLTAILARHDLEVISPADLPDFLGASGQPRTVTAEPQTRSPGEDEAWAAAAALSPAPIVEATAFDLRRGLELRVSPWAFRALRSESSGPPGHLWWPAPMRAQRLAWLCAAEQHVGKVAPDSLLDRALSFWEGLYDREVQRRAENEAVSAWAGTPAQQHLLMERALLHLWRRPGVAARELYVLYRGALREPIRSHLALFAPAGWGEEDQVEFPWKWEDRSAIEKATLQEMGLGGGLPFATLRRPGRLWMAIGICGGLALGSFYLSAKSEWNLPGHEPIVEPFLQGKNEFRNVRQLVFLPNKLTQQSQALLLATTIKQPLPLRILGLATKQEEFTAERSLTIFSGRAESPSLLRGQFYRKDVIRFAEPGLFSLRLSGYLNPSDLGIPFYQVSVSNRRWTAGRFVPSGSRVRIRWRTEERPCVIEERTAEIWRCGTRNDTNIPSLPGTQQSIAILNVGSRPLWDVRYLAITLLDSGSADVVALSSDWTRLNLSRLLGPALHSSKSQVLFFSSAENATHGLESLQARRLWIKVADWRQLADSFHFEGVRAAKKVLDSGVQSLEGDADPILLRGLGGKMR